jgi:hypothetical protein
MSTTAIAAAGGAALLKKIIDDLYVSLKQAGTNYLGRVRSDVKEATICRALARVTKVKTLWNVEKEVSLYDFYYPSRVDFGSVIKQVSSLKELGPIQNFVIHGTAGQGKSIFLRYLCGQELVAEHSSDRLPVFVELRRLSTELTVQSLILESLQKYKLPHSQQAWDYLADSGRVVLLLDAFDEIDPSLAQKAVADIEHQCELHADTLQIVITSRPDSDIHRSARFRVCKLSPLQTSDHLPFLKKICAEKGQAESLHAVLQKSSTEIKDLLTTPLMMTLLVILYKSMQTIPDTVPKFYEELFDVLFYRHDQSKPGFRRKRHTQLDDSRVKKLFSAFCFYVRLEKLGVLTGAQFVTATERACKSTNESVDPAKFRDEMIKTVCLMQQDGFEYSFIHKSVAQYYAAEFVRASGDEFARNFYALAARPPRSWDLELRFLSQIDAYRYARQYELPLLLRVAQQLGYSFDNPNPSEAARNLTNHAAKDVGVVFRDLIPSEDSENYWRTTSGRLAFWTGYKDDTDEVMNLLGNSWAGQLLRTVRTDSVVESQMFITPNAKRKAQKSKAPKLHYAEPYYDPEPLKNHLALLKERHPDLGIDAITTMQERHSEAQLLLRVEREKAEMLAALLKG